MSTYMPVSLYLRHIYAYVCVQGIMVCVCIYIYIYIYIYMYIYIYARHTALIYMYVCKVH